MKKNWILMTFLLALGSWMFVACQDDEPDVGVEQVDTGMKQMLKGITNPKIREAALWYEGHQPASLLARGGAGKHPLFEMMHPAWSYAYASISSSSDQYISVEVPLRARSRTLFTLPENAMAYDETKNSMYIQSLTRLVVQTDKKNGSSRGFFMTLVPSKKYMDAKKFNVYRSTYFRRDKDFDGYVYFHELDGSFSNGWRYADGKITHSVEEAKEDASLSRGGHWEGIRVCHPKYNRVCTYIYETNESGDRVPVEVNCYEEYAGEVCQTELVWVPDPGTGGESGGGYEGGVDIPENIQKLVKSITEALKKIGLSDKVLNKLTVRMGVPPFGVKATVTTSGSVADVLFGDTPFVMTLDRDSGISSDEYKLVLAHEYYHLYIYGISREAGSANELFNYDQKLQTLLNQNVDKNSRIDVNGAHHQYMGYDNVKYEQFLRDAFPGESEEFYKHGKWGGGVMGSNEYNNLSTQEKNDIQKYLTDNNLML